MKKLLMYTTILMLLIPITQSDAEARRGGGFSRSFGRSFGRSMGRSSSFGRRSSWGSRTTGYKKKGGLFGRNSRSSRGRSFGKKRSLAPRTHNRNGRKLLSNNFASKSSHSSRSKMFRSRHNQPRTMLNPRYYGGRTWGSWGWGMGSVGVWDLFFLSTVNHMFWYHHWHNPSIQNALYQNNLLQKEELSRLEARVKELEGQGVKRNPNYLPEGVDPDIAHSKDFVKNNPDELYQTTTRTPGTRMEDRETESGGGLSTLAFLFSIGLFFYLGFVRKF